MEFGLQMRADWETTLGAARWAEDRGLAAFAMPDHYLQLGKDPSKPAWDHLVHIAALARETRSIELVSLLSPVTFRHPAVIYKMGVTLDEISSGRYVQGVGAGWMDEEFRAYGIPYPDIAVRYEMLEECLAYLRAALAPGRRSFEGHHFQLAEIDPHPHPSNLRLLVGGTGKVKTPTLAGRFADEYNIYVCSPAEFSEKSEVALQAAAAAGRSPADLKITSAGPAIAAESEPDYRRLLARVAELTGRSAEHIEKTYQERQWPHGYGARPAEMLSALAEAGCERFYMQVFAADPEEFDSILAAFRG